MKTFVKLLFLVACIGVIASCEKEGEILQNDLKSAEYGADNSGEALKVTLPFKAEFVGTYMEGTGPNSMCGEWDPARGLFWVVVINEGEGNATHLGKFSHHFEFCADFYNGDYPGPTGHMEAWFVSANGDTLFVDVAGVVLDGRLDHHPEDVNSYFTDPWTITGGTGRFEGATGSGMTDDYNRDSYPQNSFHHWTGTITMKKGKR
ncbi:MAG: hypothetical protein R3182_14980 [Draconibacterium sp.]|nr:hypothetical protein [Draconibacterium sp.]